MFRVFSGRRRRRPLREKKKTQRKQTRGGITIPCRDRRPRRSVCLVGFFGSSKAPTPTEKKRNQRKQTRGVTNPCRDRRPRLSVCFVGFSGRRRRRPLRGQGNFKISQSGRILSSPTEDWRIILAFVLLIDSFFRKNESLQPLTKLPLPHPYTKPPEGGR